MSEFKRERKYLVLKLSDIHDHLPAPLIDHLSSISEEVAAGRQMAGKTPLLGVFVEDDWPEHEIVWAMIKDRVEGRPNALTAERAVSDRLLEALKLWRIAADNAEECEFDDMAAFSIPMPLFCDADEATDAAIAEVEAMRKEQE